MENIQGMCDKSYTTVLPEETRLPCPRVILLGSTLSLSFLYNTANLHVHVQSFFFLPTEQVDLIYCEGLLSTFPNIYKKTLIVKSPIPSYLD
jgi:hypothetical protein